MNESNGFYFLFLLNGLQRLDREEEVFHTLMIESQRPPNLGGLKS